MHAAQVADELSEREQALRRLPLPFALALRLRDAGIAADVICEYINIDQAALRPLPHCRSETPCCAESYTLRPPKRH
jgi:hypothetical protein